MFKRKSILPFLIVLSLIFTAAGYAFAAGFKDTQGHWAESQINKWAENGLAAGYSDGTFKPNNQVTRAEFVALVNRAFGIETQGLTANFSDVNSGQWYYNDIAAASAAGYTGGYPDDTFKPQQSISRQEAASIMARLLELEPTTQGLEGFKDAGQIPQWSRSSIGAIAKAGLMAGYPDGTFQPGRNITRAEAVVTLDRAREFAPVAPPVVEETTLQGTVTLDGKAVSGATVRVFKAGSYEDIKETETDSKGYFEFALAAGDYDLTAVTDTEVAYQSDITVAKDEKATAKLELVPAAIISGTIYDKGGKNKVKEAKLLFTTNPTFVNYTDKDGNFNGAVLPDRTYTVRAYKPGMENADPYLIAEGVAVGAAGNHSLGTMRAPFSGSASSGGGGGGGGGGGDTPDPQDQKPYIKSITNGTVDQQNNKIILDKEPSKISDLEIELYSPSGYSTLEINLKGNKLGSWDFVDGFNDITLGNSIGGFNIATTAAALLEAGLSYQDVLDAVKFSSLFEAIEKSSSKHEFYDEVVYEIAEIAYDDENIAKEGREAIIKALNIPAIYNAADTNTRAKIKEILEPAVKRYNNCAGDSIDVKDLVYDYVNTLDKIAKSDCREAFYNALDITALYNVIKSSSNKSSIIDAINEKAIIDAITEHADTTTIAAMAMKVYVYLDELDTDSKKEILNTVNLGQLMINISEKVKDDLKVIVKDKENTGNQTEYTVEVGK